MSTSEFETESSDDTQSSEPSSTSVSTGTPAVPPAWRPLTARQRRVLGTLMEKSKTTPDAYPMTYLALTTGCNQKSNRDPVNNYSQDQIEESVDQLREMGAIAIVQGNGRVPKVRHYGYQWLGISKVESAIMTELLLRGQQTVGELRTRASRMEPIADLATLNRLLHELQARKLVLFLSPEGRGQLVSHNLYQETELAGVKQAAAHFASEGSHEEESTPAPSRSMSTGTASPAASSITSSSPPSSSSSGARSSAAVDSGLAQTVIELQQTVQNLSKRLRYLEEQLGVQADAE